MKHSLTTLALLLSLLAISLGCGKKDEGSAKASDKPASEAVSGDLPAECQLLMEQVEALSTCDQIPKASQDSMKAGYKQMMKSMIKGCIDGQKAIQSARTTAGC